MYIFIILTRYSFVNKMWKIHKNKVYVQIFFVFVSYILVAQKTANISNRKKINYGDQLGYN
jgi:hypothetical protein